MVWATRVGEPTEEERQERRSAAQRIFATAQELFYRRGIRDVGVEEIVKQSGVTKPSLYRAFASKDELVALCLEAYEASACAEMERVMADAGDDAAAQLRAYVRYCAEEIAQPGFRGCPMSNTAVEFSEPTPAVRQVLERSKLATRAMLVEMTRRMGVAEPDELADGVLLLIEGAYSVHHVFGSQGPAQTLERSVEALISAHRAGS